MKTITRNIILIAAIIASFSSSPLKAQVVQYSLDGLSGTLDLNSYTDNMNTGWEINVGINKVVKLTINTNTESGYDYVNVYSIDNDDNYIPIATLDGTQSETITTFSASGRVYIAFSSDVSVCSNYGYTGFNLQFSADNAIVSYAYDQAGNRISRKIVPLNSSPANVKKHEEDPAPVPVVEQLGERTITIYPNPTKGALGVEITGGNDKDEMRMVLFGPQGTQLQSHKVRSGTTSLNLSSYPTGWYILRVQAGEKMTEFKIIKD